jgi:hypothetical protein
MLVAGRVGGLTNYELFTQYQELAMTMFGGYINYTWNRVTKKLSIVRKIPYENGQVISLAALTASGTATGSTITITLTAAPKQTVAVGDSIYLQNCPIRGYTTEYRIITVDPTQTIITVAANQTLGATSVTGTNLQKTTCLIPDLNPETNNMESVLLWIYNYKPDSLLLSDPMVYPWLQDYALAFCKTILGQARGKFSSLAGPQGGTQLNGAALMAEGQAEMEKLELDLKNYVDGSQPLTWVIG